MNVEPRAPAPSKGYTSEVNRSYQFNCRLLVILSKVRQIVKLDLDSTVERKEAHEISKCYCVYELYFCFMILLIFHTGNWITWLQ